MSGFLPEGLANWALGGGGQGDNNEDQQTASSENNETQAAPISEQDMRAKRMARLAALEKKSSGNGENDGSADMEVDKNDAAEPMQVDPDEGKKQPAAATTTTKVDTAKEPAPAPVDTPKPKNTVPDVNMAEEPAQKKPKSPSDPLTKLRRKKILLIRRVLQVTFGTEPSDRTPACVHLELDDDEVYNSNKSPNGVNIGHITDLLVSRLSLHPSSRSLETMPPQKPGMIAYLAGCHKRAGEEWKDLKQKKKGDGSEDELCGLLEEIRKQVVSYAASSLQIPDLFELGNDSCLQLAKCLSTTTTDPSSSVTFDVMGKNTSFYYCVCEELHSQDPDAFETMVADIVTCITDALSKCKTLLDESPPDAGLGGNGLLLTSALRELCTNKKAATCLTQVPSFLMPPADSEQASEWIGGAPPPQIPRGANQNQIDFIRQLQGMSNSRMRRSGKGLEMDTVLGNVLRLGLPWKHESVMSSYVNPVRRTPKDIDQISDGHRRQLELYQSKCNELIRQLVVAGEQPRQKVIQWLTDALLVNAKADAIEKDTTKISSEELLYNLSVVLLKLCDPFVSKPEKAALIDPGFVTSPKSHGGVYDLAGDNALTRLGDNISHSGDGYNPKNSFIPLCFFFCSRALALSIVPSMANYERMASHVNNTAWRIRQANGDIYTDRRFNRVLQFQCAMGIVVKSPTYASDVFRFYNAVAGFLLRLDSDQLKTMPEHMVSDACAVLDFASGHTVGLLSGIDFGNSFRLTVKLLSKDCAKLVRNYNLRASLGDILHNIFLPQEDSSRRNQIPESVICDPLSGGRPYLVSDKMCQDTLAPSLLLLYGEVETTGFYEKSQHRVKIAALLKYLWDSPEHKPAFRKIAEDQESFITFANGIINDMNDKFAGIMEKLPAIRTVQLQMANPQEWAAISEEERETILERHEENERGVENTLSLCDTVLKMLGFLNTDKAIRDMFLLPDMCPRLANMLLFVLTKLVGSRGLDLKVDNPEKYNFRPKEMLQNVCVVFSSFADAGTFQAACAKSGYYTPDLLSKSVKTCRKLGLLVGESMELFEKLEGKVEEVAKSLGDDEEIYEDAPDEFLDPLMSEFMIDPVILPTSNTVVDRATIQQHLLNDPTDPFNRKPLSIDDVVPAEELKKKMKVWLDAKRSAKGQN